MNKDFFSMTESGVESGAMSEEQLVKALSAGYGTDSATYINGRAMMPEDIELTMVNAMREQREDCKLMNKLKTRPVKSTVHEYNRRTEVGDYENLSVGEGDGSPDTNQSVERVTRQVKFLQTRRAVTDQMEVVDSFENAYESEKLSGTLAILKGAERMSFHGDSSVIPTEWDGLIKQILKSKNPNVSDLRGQSIGSAGEEVITDMIRMISESGGDASTLFMPMILGMDIQNLARDRIRFGTNDRSMTPVFDSYPTPYGTIKFGEEEGVDKFYRVKGIISANGNPQERPAAPAATASAAAPTDGSVSQFLAADAGNYKYTIHAINKFGISDGFPLAANVVVAAGNVVTLTITPAASNPGTGFIICRSTVGGSKLMELARIGIADAATTVFVDLNKDLPGTASMLFLTEKKLQTIAEFYQLLPLRVRPLFESNKAEKPFFVQLWGAPDLKVPEWCGLIQNIAYQGGLY
jgi:hypothetical protein